VSNGPRIDLSLRRKTGITAVFRRLHPSRVLQQALSDRYFVSLEQGGDFRCQQEIETDWGSSGDTGQLLEYLNRYRMSPDGCEPVAEIRQMLRKFLFCHGKLDGPVTSLWTPGSELYLTGHDATLLPLLLNVPWELADAVPGLERAKSLGGTLAALPIARIVKGLKSAARFEQERLRVAYCISEPTGVTPIGAKRFQEWFDLVLRERSGVLDYAAIVGQNYAPRMAQIQAELGRGPAHIFVMVSHGRTVKGKPELRLEDWIPVEALARDLAASQKTFLALIIACDQAFLEDGPTAHSGAYRLLEAGIPAVVAMQSKVQATLAATFLGMLLDQLLAGLPLAAAVAAGRKSMASSKGASEIVDWSFPALFETEDGPERICDLGEYFQFRPAWEALLRSIPKSERYFPREGLELAVTQFLRPGCTGLRVVIGAAESGRAELIREVCRRAIQSAIDRGDTGFRPVLYVDLNRYADNAIDTAAGLAAILTDRVQEVKPAVSGPALIDLKLPRARGADGSGLVRDQIRQLVELVDQGNLVLLLDNADSQFGSEWEQFLEVSATLLHSAVIVVRGDHNRLPPLATDSIVEILPLTREETRAYVQRFAPDHAAEADRWFEETAGMPYFLQSLPQGVAAGAGIFSMTISRLAATDQQLMFMLALLPNGVSTALAWDFLPGWQEADVPGLVRQGLLLSESRFGLGQQWFRIPGMVERSLRASFAGELRGAAEGLTNSFAERIGAGDAETELLQLADWPGGIQFIQDVQALLIELASEESLEQARALSVLLHEYLFGRARWWDDYLLTKRILAALPLGNTDCSEWLRLAKSQHVLGLGDEARASLVTAEKRTASVLDQVEMIDLRINLIKDSGDSSRFLELMPMYEQAFTLLDGATGEDERALAAKRATLLYNRGILRQHWGHDLNGALQDLEAAESAYRALANREMEAMAATEWVDVQLSAAVEERNWPALLERLAHARNLLEELQASGDLGFCHYQVARFYRRRSAANNQERRNNLSKARQAYRNSANHAGIAGDTRQEAAAEGQLVELAWKELGEMGDGEAIAKLNAVIAKLRTFRGDAWSSRLMRDMLSLLVEVQLHGAAAAGTVHDTLKAAWEAATADPLDASKSTDARRAARILALYLGHLSDPTHAYETDMVAASAKSLIEQWLKQTIDPTRRDWLPQVRAFGRGPGEYHG
jgi:hypothetical protein